MDTRHTPEEIKKTAKRVARSARAVSLLAQLARADRGLRLWALDERPPGFALLEREALARRELGPADLNGYADRGFATDLGRLVSAELDKLSPR